MLVTFSRHMMRELGKALGLALLVFSFVMLTFYSIKVVQHGVGFLTLFSIMLKLFPLVSPQVLPLTIITGTLVCYGRFASNNEYTASQASGIHPAWVAAPALIVATLATTITVYLNDSVITGATVSINNTIVSAKTEILRRQLAKPGSFLFHEAAICRLKREAGQAGLDITFFTKEGSDRKHKDSPKWDPNYPHQVIRIIARDHEKLDLREMDDGSLCVHTKLKHFQQLDLVGKELQVYSAESVTRNFDAGAEGEDIPISPDRITYWGLRRLIDELGKRQVKMAEAGAKITDIEKKNELSGQDRAAIKRLKKDQRSIRKSVLKLTSELHFKLALSFSCIGFALIGIPLGLRGKTHRATIGFAYGLALALGFFLIVKGLHVSARIGHIPSMTIWLPTVALPIIGLILWYRLGRSD